MCKDCGCGHGGDPADHSHDHAHAHSHPAPGGGPRQILDLAAGLLDKNARAARRNRNLFAAKKLLVLNVLSSPGSGKTALLQKTAELLRPALRLGVIVGDLATDNDAARLRQAGVPVVQITTGTLCHLEADMVARAMTQLDLDALDILVIENVGNLVCPADFDLGEQLRVVLLSVTEGEDKPLKYQPMFHTADVVLVTKTDLAAAVEFRRDDALANLRRIAHHARLLEVSARTGAGMADWIDYLKARRTEARG